MLLVRQELPRLRNRPEGATERALEAVPFVSPYWLASWLVNLA
jgi:hypothetical protein